MATQIMESATTEIGSNLTKWCISRPNRASEASKVPFMLVVVLVYGRRNTIILLLVKLLTPGSSSKEQPVDYASPRLPAYRTAAHRQAGILVWTKTGEKLVHVDTVV